MSPRSLESVGSEEKCVPLKNTSDPIYLRSRNKMNPQRRIRKEGEKGCKRTR